MQKKAIRSILWMQALLCAMLLFACSNDDDNSNAPLPKPDPKELKVLDVQQEFYLPHHREGDLPGSSLIL